MLLAGQNWPGALLEADEGLDAWALLVPVACVSQASFAKEQHQRFTWSEGLCAKRGHMGKEDRYE
jgi:hypothetical protein